MLLSSTQVLPEIKCFNIGPQAVLLKELQCKIQFKGERVPGHAAAEEDRDAGSCDSHGRAHKKRKVEKQECKPEADVCHFLAQKLKVNLTCSLTFPDLKNMVKESFGISSLAKQLIEEQGYKSKSTTLSGKSFNGIVNHSGERMGLRE